MMDQKKVLTASIDQLIFNIDTNPELKQLLIRFAEEENIGRANLEYNKDIENLGGGIIKKIYKECR